MSDYIKKITKHISFVNFTLKFFLRINCTKKTRICLPFFKEL